MEISDKSLIGLDLTDASLPEWRFNRCRLLNCRFEGASCRDWIVRSCVVEDCSFAEADLRDSHSSDPKGRMRWEGVTFSGADLRGTYFEGAELRNCDFARARFKETEFRQCRLEECRFAGRVTEVVFDGRQIPGRSRAQEMAAVDFSKAKFGWVDFRGYTLAAVVMPEDPDVVVIKRLHCVADAALRAVAADDTFPAKLLKELLKNALPWTSPEASWVFNKRDFLEAGGRESVELAEAILGQAAANCS